MSGKLPFTGERFVPGVPGEIWSEHWHRYHFAARWAEGQRVLDVACGEGYGAALLARSAQSVVGADISREAVAHARSEYASLANLSFVEAPCTRLPLADASIDLAVSFETVEHIAEQEAFLDELARVLAPGGVLLISSPNKVEYSDKRSFANEFHVKELYRDEFERLLKRRFAALDWYGQKPNFYSVIAPEALARSGQLAEVAEARPAEASPRLEAPLYFIVAAARERAPLEKVAPALSVLADRDEWMYRDYGKALREAFDNHHRAVFAEGVVAERDCLLAETNAAHQREREVASRAYDELRRASEAHAAALEATLASERSAHEAALLAKQHEVDRRGGLRWWLKLPLIRMGLLK
jgi:ubiquinone/menaquinone biosynthesis C-methylase UbiE